VGALGGCSGVIAGRDGADGAVSGVREFAIRWGGWTPASPERRVRNYVSNNSCCTRGLWRKTRLFQ